MSEKTDLKSILMEAKRKVEELPQSRSNRELWERINAPGFQATHAELEKRLAQAEVDIRLAQMTAHQRGLGLQAADVMNAQLREKLAQAEEEKRLYKQKYESAEATGLQLLNEKLQSRERLETMRKALEQTTDALETLAVNKGAQVCWEFAEVYAKKGRAALSFGDATTPTEER